MKQSEIKSIFQTVHEVCSEIHLEIDRLTFKPTSGSGRRKQKLQKRYTLLKEGLSLIASVQMIGKDKILELPVLIQHCKNLVAQKPHSLDWYNTRNEIKKIVDKF